uniref:Fasciculation and elongation protein zeta-2-like n=1 Tax=Panagrellus redivivus TaxID=6233 RepID=A0A7E4ZRQ2_PANRE
MVAAETIMDEKDIAVPDVPLACLDDDFGDIYDEEIKETPEVKAESAKQVLALISESGSSQTSSSNASDRLSNSLEDLVGCFDQRVSQVLTDLDENTTQMAPVQVRTQDEIMSESQVWWTLTGNYGNMLPLDFSKSQIRKNQLEALNLSSPRDESAPSDAGYDAHDEEEERQQFDMHQLISQQMHLHSEHPPVSADQVIEEIDEIMQTADLLQSMTTDRTVESSVDSMYSSMRSPFTAASSTATETDFKLHKHSALNVTAEELEALPQSKLLTLMAEMEQIIMVYNSELVNELAHRDELVYEKEVKNRFVTLLVQIQDQRRKHQNGGKKKKLLSKLEGTPSPQCMTASIPFDENCGMLDTPTLESMIKILEAINEDSPQVPTLLTEYILNVVCPSTETSMIA